MEPLRVRRAEAADLEAAYDVFYENEVRGESSPPPRGPVPPALRHVSESGEVVVAELAGEVVGFAGIVVRGTLTYLSDLFVRPERQSGAVGRTLLRHLLPGDGRARWTLASTDPRAVALYARAGMRPRWPYFDLRLEAGRGRDLPSAGVEAVAADVDDPRLAEWDEALSARPRPQDLRFMVDGERAVPLWFRRRGAVVGYGFVRFGAGTVWTPDKVVVGPVGSRAAEDAAACVLAAVAWARPRGSVVDVGVPGPHPSLAPLLEAGLRIIDTGTFCASEVAAVDPERYVGSGGDLF